ncbi:MAG: hypothetical protein QOK40_148, partial [Miltoncostaeaceae bacterium]|nr:hypothetical protein [Miltoncostaeaceae bacterium]
MGNQTETIGTAAEQAVERHTDIAEIAPEWDELADRARAAPFLRPGWVAAWVDAFGGTPTLLAVRERGELKAVLPLVRGRALVELPANGHTPLAGPVADGAAAVAELARALLAAPPARTDLRALADHDPLLAA